jgi:hypothetical protein
MAGGVAQVVQHQPSKLETLRVETPVLRKGE